MLTTGKQKWVKKIWGWELIIENNPYYCLKILHIEHNLAFSWQFHMNKTETFFIKSGKIILYHGDTPDFNKAKKLVLVEGDSITIYPGEWHQAYADDGDAEVIETSTHHSDEDVYRTAEAWHKFKLTQSDK